MLLDGNDFGCCEGVGEGEYPPEIIGEVDSAGEGEGAVVKRAGVDGVTVVGVGDGLCCRELTVKVTVFELVVVSSESTTLQ